MEWKIRRKILTPDHERPWWDHSSLAPSPLLRGSTIRIYVGGLNGEGVSSVGYVDVDAEDPSRILGISQEPVLVSGRAGAFDDNGVFPASVTRVGGRVFLYYTGFELCEKIRYRMMGGLAISDDDGETFHRATEAPVMDRAAEGLFFRGGPSVTPENGRLRAVYSAGGEWEFIGDRLRPTYDIFGSLSDDGVAFPLAGRPLLARQSGEHGLGRPQIVHAGGLYRLFFCIRTPDMRYASGYAESADGGVWTRRDEVLNLPHGAPGSWDSEMVYFPNFIDTGSRRFLFYIGNDFSRAGFGYAELAAW